jgi:queuosine precursor transporter
MNDQNMTCLEKTKESLLPVFVAIFVTILVLTPSASSKFIAIGPFTIVGSTLFFPISYIFGDILTEVYGFQRSRQIIWLGLACQVFAAAAYALIDVWPAASFWQNQEAYSAILGQAPRIVFASLSAYFLGELANSYIISRMKYAQHANGGGSMSVRFFLSTVVGEFLDSFVFMLVAFAGTMAMDALLKTAATIWVLKTAYETLALPFTTKFAEWIKRRECVDVVDVPGETDYSPFRL